jgi:transcriptional regulator GlxA family with amidase domain
MERQTTGLGITETRQIVLVAFPQAKLLDVTGPCEVFADANGFPLGAEAPPPYRVEVVSLQAGAVETSSGVSVLAHRGYAEWDGPIDTLLVAGGPGAASASADPGLLGWLREVIPGARRVGSVCTGAFVLAATGALDGRRATTHWDWCEPFARRYPAVTLEPDRIWVQDGNRYTSAGVTAGMDLALALVEEDLGHRAALRVAQNLVLYLRRPGGQAQFSTHLRLQGTEEAPLRDLQAWMAEHLAEDLSVAALAERVHLSPRHFARLFRRETGCTPAEFVEQLRQEAARRRLEESRADVARIARECGFGSADAMRRVFLRTLRVSPTDYRSRFRSRPATPSPASHHRADLEPKGTHL